MNPIKALLRMRPSRDEQTSAVDLLTRTPIDQLEDKVKALKKQRPTEEIRQAMVELLARAPLAHFDVLKHIYLKHCVGSLS